MDKLVQEDNERAGEDAIDPETGDIMGLKNLFWLYFPECRYIFQNHKVYNSRNDAMSMSFDDLFWKRKFTSVIYKESSLFDRKIEFEKIIFDETFPKYILNNKEKYKNWIL